MIGLGLPATTGSDPDDRPRAVECKRAYMVPYYNSSICYCHHFEHLFLLDQINFNVYILMLCLLVVDLT